MPALATIFFDFNLPNPTTWFYFSLLVAVALFFKFSRLMSIRNWDVLTIFLLVPGLLLLLESRSTESGLERWLSYLWLLCGSGYFLVRCLLDLALVRRPALSPNLNLAGLVWLTGALFVSLVAVAVRQPGERPTKKGNDPAPIDQVSKQGVELVKQQAQAADLDGFDARTWVERTLALACHLAIVAGLVFIGWRHFQDTHAGMAAATFYLLLPYTYLLLPDTPLKVGRWHHVLPMALMIWTVAAYRKPTLAGLLLGLAAGSVYFPALVLPVWLSFYWRRGAGRFAAAFVLTGGLSLLVTGIILWMQGDLGHSLQSAMALSDWQPLKKPTTEGFWHWIDGTGVYWVYRIPVFIAYLAFVIGIGFWPAPKNLAHVLALTAGVLIGVQFWYADQGGAYVLWYLPLLLLLMFRPNLADRQPAPIAPETDWLGRVNRGAVHLIRRMVNLPEQVAGVR
jgi:hypothetical protein